MICHCESPAKGGGRSNSYECIRISLILKDCFVAFAPRNDKLKYNVIWETFH